MLPSEIKSLATIQKRMGAQAFVVVGMPNQGTAARNNCDMECHKAHTHLCHPRLETLPHGVRLVCVFAHVARIRLFYYLSDQVHTQTDPVEM